MSTYSGSSKPFLPSDMKTREHGFMDFIKTLWNKTVQNDFAGLAAEMAYNWMMALIPILIFLFSLFGMFGTKTDLFGQLMSNLRHVAPPDAYRIMLGTITELTADSSGGLALVALLGALWTSSNGAMVVEKALNRAYQCKDETRNFLVQRITALVIVAGMGIILLLCSNLIMFGGSIIDAVEHYFRPGGWMIRLLDVLRWVLPMASLVVVSMFIYAIAPNIRPHRSWFSAWLRSWPGALVFVILWVAISSLFSIYVSNMANYNRVYGSMGAIIVLMFWLYLTSYALLIGGQINALRDACDEPSQRSSQSQ
jgi:membrane protein